MSKPVVEYTDLVFARVDASAWLRPRNHPNPHGLVSNTEVVRTSNVIGYDQATGRIETQNTIYIPVGKANP